MQRNTVQRKIVLDALLKLSDHPTIEEIYTEVNKTHPSISKTTIYRNLRHLAKNGMIRQVSLPDGLERYDAIIDKHYHFRCKNCNSIFDVDTEFVTEINEAVQQKYGFQVDRHDIVFAGTCLKCSGIRKGE